MSRACSPFVIASPFRLISLEKRAGGVTLVLGFHMSQPTPKKPARTGARRKQPDAPRGLPPIVCSRCSGPIVPGQHVAPLFSAKLVRWSEHPVLSKPPMIRGIIATDGSPGRVDMSVGDQLRQRAAMGGERERAELAAFEALLSKCIADALDRATAEGSGRARSGRTDVARPR